MAAALLFAVLYGIYMHLHPDGFAADVLLTNSNQAFGLVLVSMAQAADDPFRRHRPFGRRGHGDVHLPCFGGGQRQPLEVALGVLLCLAAGAAAGLFNGLVIVYGRLQPLIATIATGALFLGIAMFLRPAPGGEVDLDASRSCSPRISASWCRRRPTSPIWRDPDLADPACGRAAFGLAAVPPLDPRPRRLRGRLIRGLGLYVRRAGAAAKIAAYTLAGLLAAIGGLFVAFLTCSGDAKAAQAGTYTLNSIAAVVIGGTPLTGGIGGRSARCWAPWCCAPSPR